MARDIKKKRYGLGDIFAHAWDVFSNNFKLILIITLIVYIPINILLYFFPTTATDPLEAVMDMNKVIQLLELFIGIIAVMAIAYATNKIINKKKVDYKEAFQESLSKYGKGIGTSLLMLIFLIGLFILLIVPGIIFSIYWIFAIFVVILCDKSGKEALDYSKKLVENRWWYVFGVFLVFVIISIILGLIIGSPFLLLPSNLLLDVISFTLADLVGSFFVVATTIFFINLNNLGPQKA